MLLIAAASPITIGRRWHHCYKYCIATAATAESLSLEQGLAI